MVLPLLAWGVIASAGAFGIFSVAQAGGSKSEQNTSSEQVSKNENKQSADVEAKVSPNVTNTSKTTNTQNFNYDFAKAYIQNSSLGLGGQSLTPNTSTSPKTDAKVSPTSSQGTETTPSFSSTPTLSATNTTEQAKGGIGSLFGNPFALAGAGVGAYLLYENFKPEASK